MSGRNVMCTVAGLAVTVLVAVTPVASSAASAQEAIMFETIGAVRMMPPDEVQRMATERENAQRALLAPQPRGAGSVRAPTR